MNFPDPNAPTRSYSPFGALMFVFVVLIFLQTTYLSQDSKEQSGIENARTQLKPALAHARTINETTEAVGRDLVALSTNSAEAASIVAEFKIRLNQPPQGSK